MKLNCGLSYSERYREREQRLEKWRPWFAWFPVRVATRDCRWLEYVERRYKWGGSWIIRQAFYRPLNG